MSIVDNKTVDGIALTDDNKGIILLISVADGCKRSRCIYG